MKKIYYSSPILPVFTFIGFSMSTFIVMVIGKNFMGNEVSYLQSVVLVGFLCCLAWVGLIIKVEDNFVSRRLFVFFISKYNINDVEEIIEVSEKDALGEHDYTQIRFKNGKKWNITMFKKKDIEEIKKLLRR